MANLTGPDMAGEMHLYQIKLIAGTDTTAWTRTVSTRKE